MCGGFPGKEILSLIKMRSTNFAGSRCVHPPVAHSNLMVLVSLGGVNSNLMVLVSPGEVKVCGGPWCSFKPSAWHSTVLMEGKAARCFVRKVFGESPRGSNRQASNWRRAVKPKSSYLCTSAKDSSCLQKHQEHTYLLLTVYLEFDSESN